MQIEQEKAISPDDIVFLDRAIPDALAYYRFLNLPEDEKLRKHCAMSPTKRYLFWIAFHW